MFKQMKDIELYFEQRQHLGVKPGLSRIRMLLAHLDNPQTKFQAIHVAGTNGKGSTIHFIKQALMANGYRVGWFTSPSFTGLTGHIFLNQQPISEEEWMTIFRAIYPIIEKMDQQNNHPTNFEILTAMAFVFFTRGTDLVLLETGMGGKKDTTNCIVPLFSIITNVSKDHTGFLGDTLTEIASHKAGIIKTETPVIVGEMNESAFAVIEREAHMKHANVYKLSTDFTYTNVKISHHQSSFTWSDGSKDELQVSLTMAGVHQVHNATVAIKALKLLEKYGLMFDWKQALMGIQETQVPGRFERVSEQPMVILDGAHNVAGMDAFLQTVTHEAIGHKKHLVFAGFQDKELLKMIHQCLPHFDTVIWTSFDHSRAASHEAIMNVLTTEQIKVIDDWQEALDDLLVNAHKEDTVYITGSLHFISLVRKYFNTK